MCIIYQVLSCKREPEDKAKYIIIALSLPTQGTVSGDAIKDESRPSVSCDKVDIRQLKLGSYNVIRCTLLLSITISEV